MSVADPFCRRREREEKKRVSEKDESLSLSHAWNRDRARDYYLMGLPTERVIHTPLYNNNSNQLFIRLHVCTLHVLSSLIRLTAPLLFYLRV